MGWNAAVCAVDHEASDKQHWQQETDDPHDLKPRALALRGFWIAEAGVGLITRVGTAHSCFPAMQSLTQWTKVPVMSPAT